MSKLIYFDTNAVSAYESVLGHKYTLVVPDFADMTEVKLTFQNGSIEENGVNGISSEVLLAVLINRTERLNKTNPCKENAVALKGMKQALKALESQKGN